MDLLHPRCAGLDVHKDTVVACVRLHGVPEPERFHHTFGTTTDQLLELHDWLAQHEVTHIVMEATGVYWKPVWHVLEEQFELTLANAAHVKNVPGRKTDVNDSTWLADLHAHGLVAASFVPPKPIQALRALTRTRKQLVRERARHTQRIDKVLEEANIRLSSVITDRNGKSGRALIKALANGETNTEELLELLHGRLKTKRSQVRKALRGNLKEHHRLLLRVHVTQLEALEQSLEALTQELGGLLEPFRESVELLKTIPGFGDTTAEIVMAEIGADMSRFPNAAALRSWSGLCPGQNMSAGKRKSSKTRKGSKWLKTAMVQAAKSAARTKGSVFREKYLRLKSRIGTQKATVALAANLITVAYAVLRDRRPYTCQAVQDLEAQVTRKQARHLAKRLEQLGFEVQLQPKAA